MEYDCENARYSQPGVRAHTGLSMWDQKVGMGFGNGVFHVRQSLVLFQGVASLGVGVGLCWSAFHHCDKMPKEINLKQSRFVLTHGFIPWSLSFIVPRSR